MPDSLFPKYPGGPGAAPPALPLKSMVLFPPLPVPVDGKLVHNITWFARALRKAGLPVGPGRVVEAVWAVAAVGFTGRADFYWALHASLVSRPEDGVVFAQLFRLFWRDPQFLEHMMSLMLPSLRGVAADRLSRPAERRAAEALLDGVERPGPDAADRPDDGTRIEVDASATASAEERLRQLDFEQMSVADMAAARRMLARLRLPVRPLVTRRTTADPRGQRPDWAATMRASVRQGGEIAAIRRQAATQRWPNLVALCDISGSMSHYSRVVLQFLHAVANQRGANQRGAGRRMGGWARVHGFTFGTRLTNITRHLRGRDVDAALAAAGAEAQDWDGGTRIGDCLHEFNRDWSRRVLGQGAVVLLITDGLERGDPEVLSREMQRLQLSARRLIWINPLLRWDGFAPRSAGIRAMLPHVDCFRAGHNIAALEALALAISEAGDSGEKTRLLRAMER